MPNSKTWILVANSSQAKVFKLTKFPEIEEIQSLDHPESRLHNQDLVTDRPGRGFQSTGESRSSYQPSTEPKAVEIEKFAQKINGYLSAAHNNGEFVKLYVMANPTFLGILRSTLHHNIQKVIIAEVDKDMTDRKKSEIEEQISALSF